MLLDDTGGEGGMRKEGRHVKIVVSLDEDSKWTEVRPLHIQISVLCYCSWSISNLTFSSSRAA